MTAGRARTKMVFLALTATAAGALALGSLAQSAVADETEQTVAMEGGKITILTKTFKPPGKWTFKKFGKDSTPENKKPYNPGSYVDIIFDPEACVFSEIGVVEAEKVEALKDGDDAIQVKVTGLTLAQHAGQFPFYCEGNLKRPPSKGAYPPLKHWSVKVSRLKLYWETYDKRFPLTK